MVIGYLFKKIKVLGLMVMKTEFNLHIIFANALASYIGEQGLKPIYREHEVKKT